LEVVMANPFKEVFDLEKRELPGVALLFLFFFLVIAVFQILKPLKNGLFIELLGADLELYAKLANIAVAAVGVVAFTYLYDRINRKLVYVLCLFFLFSFLLFTQILDESSPVPVWAFYLLGDLESTLMVAAFWAYATDITTPNQALRFFGIAGSGGVIGGWVGITFARQYLKAIGMDGLLILAAGMMALLLVIVFLLEKLVRSGVFAGERQKAQAAARPTRKGFDSQEALEGFRLVARSRYLAAIVGIMASYEIASQIMDYQFKLASEDISGVTNTQAFMAQVYFVANILAVVVQLFLVSLIMRRFGVLTALLILPLALIVSSAAYLAVPTLYVASLLVISDNGLNYSVQQTARESLYAVTTDEEKYKARAFTSMFVQRLAKGAAIFVLLALGALAIPARYLGLLTITVVLAMVWCAIYAGRRFAHKNAEMEKRAA
jgi:ATP:ADP antiporter, AAA family